MKKALLFILTTMAILISCGFLLIGKMAGAPDATPEVISHNDQLATPQVAQQGSRTFSVLSLNLAHGRRENSHQITLTTPQIRENLDTVISLLKREQPDIVALQEADESSFWSGRFSHVGYLATAGYNQSVHGINVNGFGLSYGTALLSKAPLFKQQTTTFKPSLPTLPKGFVMATVQVTTQLQADLISVHLDFFSKKTREHQVQEMVRVLSKRDRPLIIMGDFNTEWQKGSAPQVLSEQLGLTTYKPTTNTDITFPTLHKRIDFILASKDFKFINYKVLKDVVSDHRAILAELQVVAQYKAGRPSPR